MVTPAIVNELNIFRLRYSRSENTCGFEQAQTAIAFFAYYKMQQAFFIRPLPLLYL
jgi:hypothetical protein